LRVERLRLEKEAALRDVFLAALQDSAP
jgi:hypothetical protein